RSIALDASAVLRLRRGSKTLRKLGLLRANCDSSAGARSAPNRGRTLASPAAPASEWRWLVVRSGPAFRQANLWRQKSRRFLAADASQKSLPGLGPRKSRGLRGSCNYKSRHPVFAIVGMHDWRNWRDPVKTTGTADRPVRAVRRAWAPKIALRRWILAIGSCRGKILCPLILFSNSITWPP